MSGIKKESAVTPKTILYCGDPCVAVPAILSATGAATVEGKKIVKAGTPVAGDLTARNTAFTKATTTAVGVVQHDTDVTDGDANGSVILFGFVDMAKLDDDVAAQITTEVKTALNGKITFLK